jgi:acyl-coenzyme A synthetase/AMP-(fatty) acid ligase/acyl carrier protein
MLFMRSTGTWYTSPFTLRYPERVHETLLQSLYRVTQQNPKAIALIDNNREYTFHELCQRIAGMAEQIQGTDTPIALLQELHINAVVAWFACALAHKPFLLLDPQHPKERLLSLMQQAQCNMVLTDEASKYLFIDSPGIQLVLPDNRLGELNPNLGLESSALTMIFPTSGSSGEPKLIAYATNTLQAKVQASIQLMKVEAEQRVLIAGSHAQYGYMHHALVFLLAGGTLCLSDIMQTGFQGIVHAIEKMGVRHIRFTPSLFRKFVQWSGALPALKKVEAVRFSGEPLLANDVIVAKSVLTPNALIQNVYGSTESALFIWSNTEGESIGENDLVPIGRIYPLASFAIQAVDDNNQLGELLITSPFQALGDYRDGEINTTRWDVDPIHLNDRIYSTGDLVRLTPDGMLLHLGRIGRMVKVNGNRVYLNEVENALLAIPGVDEAAVLDYQVQNSTHLYSFVVTNNVTVDSNALLNLLRKRLPNYMLPKHIVVVPKIPLLVGGKIDYPFLFQLIEQRMAPTQHAEIIDDEWQLLIALWDKYLWKGAHREVADFISLGGDSLGMMSFVVELEEKLGRKMKMADFSKNVTLLQLAYAFQIQRSGGDIEEQLETIYFKQYRKIATEINHTALVMPNVFGHAQVHLFKQVDLFPNYTIWGANYLMESGRLSDNERWWKSVQQMVEGILSKKIPAPNMLFGFSIGGSVAWMVARLLTDTPFSPEWVVLLDAPPLHRYAKTNRAILPDVLFNAPAKFGIKIIQIRRKPFKSALHGWININEWKAEEGIRFYIDIPTVDHDEIAHPLILPLVQKALSTIIFESHPNSQSEITEDMPNLPGVLVYRCLQGDVDTMKQIMHEHALPPEWFTMMFFIETTLAIYKLQGLFEAYNVVNYALKRFPSSKGLHYLKNRLQRNDSQLAFFNMPSIASKVFIDIEYQLKETRVYKPNFILRPLIFFYWICDVYTALWTAKMKKRRNNNHGNS